MQKQKVAAQTVHYPCSEFGFPLLQRQAQRDCAAPEGRAALLSLGSCTVNSGPELCWLQTTESSCLDTGWLAL